MVFPEFSGSNRYWFTSSASVSGFAGLLYQLRYKDSSGQPIVYDEKYFNPSRDSEHLPGTVSIIVARTTSMAIKSECSLELIR